MRLKAWLVLGFVLAFSVLPAVSQGGCSALVDRALRAIDQFCAALERNSVCYGNNQVSAQFLTEVAEDFFSKPSDRASLVDIQTIETTSLSTEREEWGVAVLNVQANVPNTLPGQAVTFILLGDAEVENAVNPADAYVPPPPIAVVTSQNSNVRSGPGTNFNRLGQVTGGTILYADARSADNAWVRILFQQNTIAWIARQNLVADAVIDTLAVPDENTRGTMQAFYLRTGVGRTECEAAPQDALLVQGPRSFEVSLTVNGARVSMGSTVMFRTLGEDGTEMEITVLDGQAEVTPDIEGGQTVIIPQGSSSRVCLGEPEDLGTDGEANDRVVTCNASPPQPIDSGLRDNTLCQLQNLPASVLHYPVDLQCPGDPLPTPTPRPVVIVPVLTSTPFTGQFDPTPVPPVVDQPPATGCTNVQVIQPYTNALPAGQSFGWSVVPGATDYRLDLFNINGGLLTSVQTRETNVVLDPARLTQEGRLYFNVLAFANGVFLCESGRIGGVVIGEPTPVAPVFSASFNCTSSSGFLSWNNAVPGSDIYFEFGGGPPQLIASGINANGSSSFYEPSFFPSFVVTGIIVTTSASQSTTLPNTTCT
jgi:hypothetical protein